MNAKDAKAALLKHGDPIKAQTLQRFFKTAKGEYSHGDRFAGITVPVTRQVARDWHALPLSKLNSLLHDPIHEVRLFSVILLCARYDQQTQERSRIYDVYLANTHHINNWDLVDISAPNIVGRHLLESSRAPLYTLARSHDLWERRIAIVSTQHFIRRQDTKETFALAQKLLHDDHDLIHKAVGWMLREAGKRDLTHGA
jgi:3-methyladenine DNA glycosylase AlkD